MKRFFIQQLEVQRFHVFPVQFQIDLLLPELLQPSVDMFHAVEAAQSVGCAGLSACVELEDPRYCS